MAPHKDDVFAHSQEAIKHKNIIFGRRTPQQFLGGTVQRRLIENFSSISRRRSCYSLCTKSIRDKSGYRSIDLRLPIDLPLKLLFTNTKRKV